MTLEKREYNYVTHTCRNKKCGVAFMDKDITNAKSRPPEWKYCEQCVKNGFPDLKRPTLTEKQKIHLQNIGEAWRQKKRSMVLLIPQA